MPAVDLTPYYQPQGSTSDGSKYDNGLALIQSTLNGLDNNNFAAGKIFDPSKLMQNSAVDGDGLAYDSAAGIWKRTTDKPLRVAALAGYPADGTKALFGDGTWKVTGSATTGTELDYAQITTASTSISATTEGTANAVVTGNSITYDGTKVKLSVYCAQSGNGILGKLVLLRDATVLGQADVPANTIASSQTVEFFDTPSAGAHTYAVKAFQASPGTFAVLAGAGGTGNLIPVFLRVTKA